MAQRRPSSTQALAARENAARQFGFPASGWTAERIARLSRKEVEQLKINAADRGVQEIVSLCDAALAGPIGEPAASSAARRARRS